MNSLRLPAVAEPVPAFISVPTSLRRHIWFLLLGTLSIATFWQPLTTLATLGIHDERYSHVLLIPILSGCLIYFGRRSIFLQPRYCPSAGFLGLALGLMLYVLQNGWHLQDQNDRLSVVVSALILVWVSAFILCYGMRSSRSALFALLFLLLMVPIPTALLDNIILALQKGSAVATYSLFKLLHVPVLWQGVIFSLPGVDIEVAKECSGIRSSLALFITGTLAAHIFLQSSWRKLVLALVTVPIAVFKNAVRIVTISTLGVYVDHSYLTGKLHHQGGPLFSVVAFVIITPLLFVLQKTENRSDANGLPKLTEENHRLTLERMK